MREIICIGKPNSGKSSLFNQLTGLNQKIGNFSGVTVEVKKGKFNKFDIIDVPGLQSLQTTSPEEKISKQQILSLTQHGSALVFVANGMQLADSLVLFSQIADLQLPMALVINFKDELAKNNAEIDTKALGDRLGCYVVLTNAKSGEGVQELKSIIQQQKFSIPNTFCLSLYDDFNPNNEYTNNYRGLLAQETDLSVWEEEYHKRHKTIGTIVRECMRLSQLDNSYLTKTKKLDQILLHPISGLLIFLLVMFLVFQAVFSLSSYPMDWIDWGIGQLSSACEQIPVPWLADFMAQALIPGIGGVLIFIPQIAILFLLLGILEQTGYLSRISYITDGFLRLFGLSGHSVVPLMSSWACAIPAIMSSRIIANPRERLAVIIASPLMTCSARLPVYTILIAIVFPQKTSAWGVQGFALLSLYLLGLVATLVVAWVVNKSSKVPTNKHWLLELPVFRTPNWKNIFYTVFQKTKSFVLEAGKVIIAISLLLWLLASFSPHSETYLDQQYEASKNTAITQSKDAIKLEYSYLGYIGKAIEPSIRPLGYDWKIGIALVSSFAAREVFVGTLSSIYSIASEDEGTIISRLREEKNAYTNAPQFNTATAVSLMLFYVFAMQCMSTLAIVRKETGTWYYAIIQFFFMLALAYGTAFIAYQLLK